MPRRCRHTTAKDRRAGEKCCCRCGALCEPGSAAETVSVQDAPWQHVDASAAAVWTSAVYDAVSRRFHDDDDSDNELSSPLLALMQLGSDMDSDFEADGLPSGAWALTPLDLDADSDSDSDSLQEKTRSTHTGESRTVTAERGAPLDKSGRSETSPSESLSEDWHRKEFDTENLQSLAETSWYRKTGNGLHAKLSWLEREAEFNQLLIGHGRRKRRQRRKSAVKEKRFLETKMKLEATMDEAIRTMMRFCEDTGPNAVDYVDMPAICSTGREFLHRLAQACRTRVVSKPNAHVVAVARTRNTRWCGLEEAQRLASECSEKALLKQSGLYRTCRETRTNEASRSNASATSAKRSPEDTEKQQKQFTKGTVHTERGRAQLQQTALAVQPVAAENRGHELMRRLGWQPGQALGAQTGGERALLEPLKATLRPPRRGLGAAHATVSSGTPPK